MDCLLTKYPQYREKLVFVQIAVPSRYRIREYQMLDAGGGSGGERLRVDIGKIFSTLLKFEFHPGIRRIELLRDGSGGSGESGH